MECGPDHARPGVDAEDRTDVRGSRAGREERFELVGCEPQREGDAFAGGLPAYLAVVVAVQSRLPVAVLETEREPLVPGEVERR